MVYRLVTGRRRVVPFDIRYIYILWEMRRLVCLGSMHPSGETNRFNCLFFLLKKWANLAFLALRIIITPELLIGCDKRNRRLSIDFLFCLQVHFIYKTIVNKRKKKKIRRENDLVCEGKESEVFASNVKLSIAIKLKTQWWTKFLIFINFCFCVPTIRLKKKQLGTTYFGWCLIKIRRLLQEF